MNTSTAMRLALAFLALAFGVVAAGSARSQESPMARWTPTSECSRLWAEHKASAASHQPMSEEKYRQLDACKRDAKRHGIMELNRYRPEMGPMIGADVPTIREVGRPHGYAVAVGSSRHAIACTCERR